MRRFLIHWLVVAIGLALAAYLVPGVSVRSIEALAIGSLVLGLVNALVRPVLAFLTFPITLLTLGLWYLVVNAICFGLAAWLVPGFGSRGIVASILGALVVTVVSWGIQALAGEERGERRKKRRGRD
jgi:putative membrane protein